MVEAGTASVEANMQEQVTGKGKGAELPGPGGAWGGSDEVDGAERGGVVAAGSQAVSLHQQEALQEGEPLEELRQRHLLLPGGAAEVREDRLHTWRGGRGSRAQVRQERTISKPRCIRTIPKLTE